VTGDPSNTLNVTLDTTPPVALTSTPPTTATNGIEVVYDAQHPEEGTPGFGYSLSGAPTGAVIDPVTGVMRWTPTIDQGGANLFQVVAKDLAGNLRTQDLSIDVTVVEQQVLIELVVIDSQENPVTTISAGEDFWVFAYVQDIRTPAEGVFAAYADILFDSTIVSSQASSLTDVVFGTKYQNGKSGFFATPGLIDEIGAFGPISPVGGGKELLFAIPFRAEQAGQVTFRLDPSDTIGREVLVFGENEPVEWNAITLADATLTVSAGLGAVNDLFNVDEDSVNFPLNVLANDVNEIGGTVTISQVGYDQPGRRRHDRDQRTESAVFAGGQFLRRGDVHVHDHQRGADQHRQRDGPSRPGERSAHRGGRHFHGRHGQPEQLPGRVGQRFDHSRCERNAADRQRRFHQPRRNRGDRPERNPLAVHAAGRVLGQRNLQLHHPRPCRGRSDGTAEHRQR
jgi:hypothetical protein